MPSICSVYLLYHTEDTGSPSKRVGGSMAFWTVFARVAAFLRPWGFLSADIDGKYSEKDALSAWGPSQGIVKPFLWLWSYCQDSWFLILCSLHTWPQPLHIHRHLQDHRHPNIHIHMLDVKMGFSYWGLDRSLKCKTVTSCFFWSRSWFLWLAHWRPRPEFAEKVVFSEVDYSDKWLTAGGGGCGLLCDK